VSTPTGREAGVGYRGTRGTDGESSRRSEGALPAGLWQPATAGVAVALGATVVAFVSVTTVVGGTGRMLAAVGLAVAVATVAARVLTVRQAVGLSATALGVGLLTYYFTVPASQRALFSPVNVVYDTVSLLTGLSVLRLTQADVWALVVAPVPAFLAWYLAARDRQLRGALVAGGALGFLVLTGDAGTATTLAGAVGMALAAGFTTVDVPGGLDAHWDTLAVVIAAMIVLSATLAVVPGGAAQPWISDRGSTSLESSLTGTGESVDVTGPIKLSPEVRFTVESTAASYWQTASYDRYTGDGWVRSGETAAIEGRLAGPPGDSARIEQTVTARTRMEALPAAWKPVAVEGASTENARVAEGGDVQPGGELREGESFGVVSREVRAEPDELRAAGDDYPDEVGGRYTQLPENTPDRVGDLTDDVVAEADADNPYDAALAVRAYLQETKEYSLSVQKPEGDVADGFLFEMDAGYCTYFATTMVTMLRTQGIPAKFVTGYTTGEEVRDGEYVVRGQNAHAWVQVYFPDHGWVAFDPTPSAPRQQAQNARLAEAREAGAENVDTVDTAPGERNVQGAGGDAGLEGAGNGSAFGEGIQDEGATGAGEVSDDEREQFVGGPGAEVAAADAGQESPIPVSRQQLGYGLLAVFGLLAGAHRAGMTGRAYRGAWLRFQRRRGPEVDVAGAYARLEYMLGRRYRPRRAGETPREYVTALGERADLDDRIHEVARLYERAAYAGGAAPEDAARAVRTVRRLALESTPGLRRLLT